MRSQVFAVLGCPRSGTNLLSSLIKHLQGTYFVVEPFSMNVRWVLRDDLCRSAENAAKLRCVCRRCYICELREEIRAGRIDFKETSLFEYLDVLYEDFGMRRVVYIERDQAQVTESYAKHNLWRTWNLAERKIVAQLPIAAEEVDDREKARAFGAMVTLERHRLWSQMASHFEVFELKYADLVSAPHQRMKELTQFLGLEATPFLGELIDMKFANRPNSHAYATFG